MTETIIGTKSDGDAPEHCFINWVHPKIYEDEERSTITISLCHVRSADDIMIKFSAERNGWVIEQQSVFEWDADDKVCDPVWKEVAFVYGKSQAGVQ
jgi:hypothetical protein